MKKQLRNMMLAGAATLLAGNAWAQEAGSVDQIAEGYDLKIEWESPTPWGPSQGRFGTAVKGANEILVLDNTSHNVYSFNKDGNSEKYTYGKAGVGISCDEAGNLIFVDGWSGAATAINVLPAEGGDMVSIPLTAPDGVELGRVDQIGRILGNVLSEDGAWITLAYNTQKAVASYYIASGEIIDAYASLATPAALNTMYVTQPWGTSVEECQNASDPSMAVYIQGANVNTIYGPNADFGDWVGYPRQSHGSAFGFDWFILGDETYFVYGGRRSDRTGSAWNCGDFFVVRQSDNTIVAAYKATKEIASGQSFGSIVAYANEDGKSATIYRWNSASGAAQLTFTVGGEEPPTVDPLYIVGANGAFDAVNPDEFTYDQANGVYTYDLVDPKWGFKISSAKGGWSEFDGAGFHIDGALKPNTVTPLLSGAPAGGANITLTNPGDYTIVVDLVNMTIEARGEVVIQSPETFFVIGQLVAGAWDPAVGVELTKNGHVFEGDVEMAGGYFSFTEKLSPVAGSAGWGQLGQRYGASTNDYELAANTSAPFMKGENAFNIVAFTEYPVTVHFVVSFADMTVTISKTTGVEEIAADAAAPAEYYNLQGLRVAQPEAGQLYIVKKGDKVSKVLMK